MVTSANPHDGSSAHGNVAVQFTGQAVQDLLATEKAVLAFSGRVKIDLPELHESFRKGGQTLQVVTEGAIKKTILTELEQAGSGDSLSLVMFYLADHDVIDALRKAHKRGASIKVLLDPNKDAFGRKKNGIPNRQVAAELTAAGIPVRWGNTHGEQLHSKMLLVMHENGNGFLILGSANFTRRNLGDFNLETDVAVRGPGTDKVFQDAGEYVDLLWGNTDTMKFSVAYADYEDRSRLRQLLYEIMESWGISTF